MFYKAAKTFTNTKTFKTVTMPRLQTVQRDGAIGLKNLLYLSLTLPVDLEVLPRRNSRRWPMTRTTGRNHSRTGPNDKRGRHFRERFHTARGPPARNHGQGSAQPQLFLKRVIFSVVDLHEVLNHLNRLVFQQRFGGEFSASVASCKLFSYLSRVCF